MQTLKVAIGFLLIGLLLAPLTLIAQTDGELEASIRAAILSDPRTAAMSEAQVNAMVVALAQEAATQGVTSQDIMWRPQEVSPEVIEERCGGMPTFFCALSEAFGFDGSDVTIPIGLGICAGLLLFLIGSILHHQYGRHPLAGSLAPSHEIT